MRSMAVPRFEILSAEISISRRSFSVIAIWRLRLPARVGKARHVLQKKADFALNEVHLFAHGRIAHQTLHRSPGSPGGRFGRHTGFPVPRECGGEAAGQLVT